MKYEANYIGYELGNFLPPDYQGHEKCDVFFCYCRIQCPIAVQIPFVLNWENQDF